MGKYKDILLLTVILIPVASLITGVVYIKYKHGLATKIFALVTPAIVTCAVLGVALGKFGLTGATLGIIVPIGTAISVTALGVLFRIVVSGMSGQVQDLLANAAQLSATAKQTAATAVEQAAMVAQVTTTVDEIKQTSRAAADNARDVLKVASNAVESGRRGLDAVRDAVRIMEAIGEAQEIVDTINDLAEQSNLLALNASIEAAKAGEHGRGFAVVAAEVRNLAEQSKVATRQIRDAISRTDEGREAIELVNVTISQLAGVLDETADKARQISGTAVQQSTGIQQISEAMTSVDQGGRDTATASQQLQEAVDNLQGIGKGLDSFVMGSAARG